VALPVWSGWRRAKRPDLTFVKKRVFLEGGIRLRAQASGLSVRDASVLEVEALKAAGGVVGAVRGGGRRRRV